MGEDNDGLITRRNPLSASVSTAPAFSKYYYIPAKTLNTLYNNNRLIYRLTLRSVTKFCRIRSVINWRLGHTCSRSSPLSAPLIRGKTIRLTFAIIATCRYYGMDRKGGIFWYKTGIVRRDSTAASMSIPYSSKEVHSFSMRASSLVVRFDLSSLNEGDLLIYENIAIWKSPESGDIKDHHNLSPIYRLFHAFATKLNFPDVGSAKIQQQGVHHLCHHDARVQNVYRILWFGRKSQLRLRS